MFLPVALPAVQSFTFCSMSPQNSGHQKFFVSAISFVTPEWLKCNNTSKNCLRSSFVERNWNLVVYNRQAPPDG